MELLKLIIDLVDSLTLNLNDITECGPDNSSDLSDATATKEKVKVSRRISQDLDGCRNAHKKIEDGEGTQITPFVQIAQYDEEPGGRTTAVRIRGPYGYGVDMSGCLSEGSKTKPTK